MKATHVGSVNNARLYYIFEDPPKPEQDGALVRPDGSVEYFGFWSVASRAKDLKPKKVTDFQTFLWDGASGKNSDKWNGIFIEKLVPVPTSMLKNSPVVTEFPNPKNSDREEKSLRASTFRRLLASGNNEMLAAKSIGRRIGRGTRMATGRMRGFDPNARFDPNAVDADRDGFVQEGTQFARPATARAQRLARQTRPSGFASSRSQRRNVPTIGSAPDTGSRPDRSKTVPVPRSGFTNIKWRSNAELHKKNINELVTNFIDEFGELKTAGDVFNAWSKLVRLKPKDLEDIGILGPNDSRSLDVNELAQHYGYLIGAYIQRPRFSRYKLKVEAETRPGYGGSAGLEIPLSRRFKFFTPRLTVTINTAPFDVNRMSGNAMDAVSHQIGLSMARSANGLDFGENSPVHRIAPTPADRLNFVIGFITGLHETSHLSHNTAMLRDSGQDIMDAAEIEAFYRKLIKSPDVYNDIALHNVRNSAIHDIAYLGEITNFFLSAAQAIDDQNPLLDAAAKSNLKRKRENDLIDDPLMFITQAQTQLRDFLDSDYFKNTLAPAASDTYSLQEALHRLPVEFKIIGALFERSILKDHMRKMNEARETQVRLILGGASQADIQAALDTSNFVRESIEQAMDSLDAAVDTVKKIVDATSANSKNSLDARRKIVDMLTGKMFGTRAKDPQFPDETLPDLIFPSLFESVARSSSYRKFADTFDTIVSRALRAEIEDEKSKFKFADVDALMQAAVANPDGPEAAEMIDLLANVFWYDSRNNSVDGLTASELNDIWNIAELFSDYASYDRFSWYRGRTNGQTPVEFIAEMLPALLIDPQAFVEGATQSELKSLEKLVRWVYDDALANRIMSGINGELQQNVEQQTAGESLPDITPPSEGGK